MSRYKKTKVRKFKKNRLFILGIGMFSLTLTIGLIINLFADNSFLKSNSIVKGTSNNINVTLSAVGDIMVHADQLEAQYNKDTKTYSFDNNFKYIAPYIESSDLAIANLETTLAGEDNSYSSFPKFNSPDTIVSAIKNSGFDIVSTINNHAYDRGSTGLYRTLDVLKSEGLESIGTRSSSSDENFIIKDVDGVKLGITSYSYAEVSKNRTALNGLPATDDDKENLNVFDLKDVNAAFNSIKSTLDEMNTNETDLQVLVMHWGNEYEREPSKFQKELAQMLCDYGVDIIIGSHPHVVQPIEMIKSEENNNETLVIYSLGNFLSNQRKELVGKNFTEDGLIVNVNITKNTETNETKISAVEYIPTWVHKYKDDKNKLTYEVIPILNEDNISEIENASSDEIKASYNNTTSIIKNTDIINIKK